MNEAQTVAIPAIQSELAREGFVVLRKPFGAPEMNQILAAAAEARGLETEARQGRFYEGVMPPASANLYAMPTLVGIARQIIGDDIALFMQRFLIKDQL